jgi:hypothetical protein
MSKKKQPFGGKGAKAASKQQPPRAAPAVRRPPRHQGR